MQEDSPRCLWPGPQTGVQVRLSHGVRSLFLTDHSAPQKRAETRSRAEVWEGATTDLQSDSERGLRTETQAGERIRLTRADLSCDWDVSRCATRWRDSSAATSPGRCVTRYPRSPAPPWRGSSARPPARPPTTARCASRTTATGLPSPRSRTATALRQRLRWARLTNIPSCHTAPSLSSLRRGILVSNFWKKLVTLTLPTKQV